MFSKQELREEDIVNGSQMDDHSIANELPPPTYSSLFSEDLLLSPSTTRDERRESILIEGTQDRKKYTFENSCAN